jgi:hypothetical protein
MGLGEDPAGARVSGAERRQNLRALVLIRPGCGRCCRRRDIEIRRGLVLEKWDKKALFIKE